MPTLLANADGQGTAKQFTDGSAMGYLYDYRLDEELRRSTQARAKKQEQSDEAQLAKIKQDLDKDRDELQWLTEQSKRYEGQDRLDSQASESAKASMAHWHEDVSTGESLIPVWGSGKQAYSNFKRGEWVQGTANTVNAISDVFMVKDLAKAGLKIGVMGLGMLGKDAGKVAAKDVVEGGEKLVKDVAENAGHAEKPVNPIGRMEEGEIDRAGNASDRLHGRSEAAGETGIERANRTGKQGEQAAGITKSKEGVRGPLSGKMRFPDEIIRTSITEVKNVAKQGWTAQLKDYAAIAEERGIGFVLKVRPSAKISSQLRAAEAAGKVIIQTLTGL